MLQFSQREVDMAKRWIKLWVAESLRGTIRFDFTPEERGIWYDLLALAGDCRQEGLIAPGDRIGYPRQWIANTLNIPLPLLNQTLKKCIKTKRIEGTKRGLKIISWAKYQSEYERQKPYRERRKYEGKKPPRQPELSDLSEQAKHLPWVKKVLEEEKM